MYISPSEIKRLFLPESGNRVARLLMSDVSLRRAHVHVQNGSKKFSKVILLHSRTSEVIVLPVVVKKSAENSSLYFLFLSLKLTLI